MLTGGSVPLPSGESQNKLGLASSSVAGTRRNRLMHDSHKGHFVIAKKSSKKSVADNPIRDRVLLKMLKTPPKAKSPEAKTKKSSAAKTG